MLKKSMAVILSVCMLFSLCACSLDKDEEKSDTSSNNLNQSESNNYLEDSQNDTYNHTTSVNKISSTGQIPYEKFDYKYCSGLLMFTNTNAFPFVHSSKYGYADAKGNVIISEKYDLVRIFSDGKAFVNINDEWQIIDMHGKELYTLPAEYNECLYDDYNNVEFNNGKAICVNDNNSSFLDVLIIDSNMSTSTLKIEINGLCEYKIINTAEFSGIITYSSYIEYDNSGNRNQKVSYNLFNLSGEKLWEVTTTYDNFRYKTEQCEYNKALAPTRPYTILESINVENGYINIFDENFKWGLMELYSKKIVLDYNYDYVGTYSDNLCNVCSYGKWGYVDLSGNQAIDFNYKYTEKFVNGKAIVIMQDNSFKVINKEGKEYFDCGFSFIPPSYSQCKYHVYTELQNNGIIIVWSHHHKKYYIINIGNSLTIIDDSSHPSIISDKYIYMNKSMYEIV